MAAPSDTLIGTESRVTGLTGSLETSLCGLRTVPGCLASMALV